MRISMLRLALLVCTVTRDADLHPAITSDDAFPSGLGIVFSPMPSMTRYVPDQKGDFFAINCAWTTPKINADAVRSLAEIAARLHGVWSAATPPGLPLPKLVIRLFPSTTPKLALAAEVMRQQVHKTVRGSFPPEWLVVTIHLSMTPEQYLSELSRSHLALDAYPYGGCNTIMVRGEGGNSFVKFASVAVHSLRSYAWVVCYSSLCRDVNASHGWFCFECAGFPPCGGAHNFSTRRLVEEPHRARHAGAVWAAGGVKAVCVFARVRVRVCGVCARARDDRACLLVCQLSLSVVCLPVCPVLHQVLVITYLRVCALTSPTGPHRAE